MITNISQVMIFLQAIKFHLKLFVKNRKKSSYIQMVNLAHILLECVISCMNKYAMFSKISLERKGYLNYAI